MLKTLNVLRYSIIATRRALSHLRHAKVSLTQTKREEREVSLRVIHMRRSNHTNLNVLEELVNAATPILCSISHDNYEVLAQHQT